MLLVNVQIGHTSHHIGVVSHSTLKNMHSGRDRMRRKAEYGTTKPSAAGLVLFFYLFLHFLPSQSGVNMHVAFDAVGGSGGAHVCTFHPSSHTLSSAVFT